MCRKAGLVQLQKSVFVGDTGANLINDLENAIKPILPTTDRFAVMPLDRQTYIDLINGSRLPSAGTAGEAFVQWEF
jgi:CRISPR/Cas system-associated endoribonuclease Cas2